MMIWVSPSNRQEIMLSSTDLALSHWIWHLNSTS